MKISVKNLSFKKYILPAYWGILICILSWFIWNNQEIFLTNISTANYKFLVLAGITYLFALMLAALGWYSIIDPLIPNLHWWVHLQIYLSTLAARRLPGSIWYIGGRVVNYKKYGISGAVVGIASGVELLIGVGAGCIIGCSMLLFGIPLNSTFITFLFAGLTISMVILHPKVFKFLLDKIHRPIDISVTFRIIVKWIGIRCLMLLLSGLMMSQIAQAFEPVQWQEILFIIAATSFSGAVSILTIFLPSSFSIYEISLVALMSQVISLPTALIVAVYSRVFTTLAEIALSLIFSSIYRRNEKQITKPGL